MPIATEEVLELKRHSFQAEFVTKAKQNRIAGFFGGLQSGKTVAGADALAELLWVEDICLPPQAKNSNPEIWILSRTYALAETAWNCFLDRWGDMVLSHNECKRLNLHRGESNTHWLKPGPRKDGKPIRCRVRTVDDPENLRATQNLLVAWCDEAAWWKEMAWLNLLGRGIVSPTRYLVTTTPRGKTWSYRDIYVPATHGKPGVGVVTCRSIDNPWANQAYLAELRLKYGEQYAAQELDALFVDNAGLVYNFDRTTHMKRPPSVHPEDYDRIVFGVDPGYGDPYAVGIWGRTTEGVWWLLEEYYKTKVTTDDLTPWFQKRVLRWQPKAIYVDKRRPSDYLFLKKHLKDVHYIGPNIEVHGETDKRIIMPQIRFCQQLLSTNKIFISPNCPFTAEEFEQYHFKDIDERNAGENPVDWKNHTMDALRYAICSVEDLPTDRRPRFRSGADLLPRSRDDRKNSKVRFCSAQEYLMAVDKKMDEKDRVGRRGDRRRERK